MLNLNHEIRTLFASSANAYYLLNAYNTTPNDELATALSSFASSTSTFILPSGRYGSILGLALEMQLYTSSLFLIQNSHRLGLNLNYVSSLYGDADILNALDTFKLTSNDFDFEPLVTSNNQDIVSSQNLNKQCALKVSEILKSTLSKVSQK